MHMNFRCPVRGMKVSGKAQALVLLQASISAPGSREKSPTEAYSSSESRRKAGLVARAGLSRLLLG